MEVFWTQARIAELKDLWEKGYSAALIANALCATRNSILGKINRLGLSQPREIIHSVNQSKRTKAKAAREHKSIVRVRAANGNSNHLRVIRTVETEQYKLRCVEVVPLNLTLAELDSTQCHYIPGDDHLYCGHPIQAGSSYCTPHHFLIWVPPSPRRDVAMRRNAA